MRLPILLADHKVTTVDSRADDGIRTRDPHLGKVMLYQLSYVRTPRLRIAVTGARSLYLIPRATPVASVDLSED